MKKTLAALIAGSLATTGAMAQDEGEAYAKLLRLKQKIESGQVDKAEIIPNIDRDFLEVVNDKHGYMFTLFVGATIK